MGQLISQNAQQKPNSSPDFKQETPAKNRLNQVQGLPSPPRKMLEERVPVYAEEVNARLIEQTTDKMEIFRLTLPLSIIHIDEYAGSIKKLVSNSDKVSVKQLKRTLGYKYDDFANLGDHQSLLTSVLFDKFFYEGESDLLDIDGLICFGVLMCKGSQYEVLSCLWDQITEGQLTEIDTQNERLHKLNDILIQLQTQLIPGWAQVDPPVTANSIDIAFKHTNQLTRSQFMENLQSSTF